MKNPYQKYKATSVQSASREKLLLMMYEGAIRFTKQSITAIEQKQIAEKGYSIGRAYDIIMELNNTLDHKIGGDISKNLEQLYMFMTDQLTQANIKNSTENLKNVLRILETLYEGWKAAVEQIKKQEMQTANDVKNSGKPGQDKTGT